MAQQSITLTASMRTNLASLKSIQKQMDTTQERLSTGKEVNSAIDNASNYYQSRALTNRASDLDALLDSMGQGIQTIEAANEGIEAVTSYVEQLKSVAESAYALDPTSNTYETQMASYREQFNTIQKEIEKLVADASYQGINLLKGGELTVTFNESRSNRFTIQGDVILDEMKIAGTNTWKYEATTEGGTVSTVTTEKEITIPAITIANDTEIVSPNGGTDKYALASDGKYYKVNDGGTGLEGAATAFAGDVSTLKPIDPAEEINAAGGIEVKAASDIPAGTDIYVAEDGTNIATDGTDWYDVDTGTLYATGADAPEGAVEKQTGGSYAAAIDNTIDTIAEAIDYLRSYATELGNNYSIIETRQNFTDALIDVLETGSDNLVLADMNEESANYLALQTRQQLAINSLSLASQSAQSILSLFQ